VAPGRLRRNHFIERLENRCLLSVGAPDTTFNSTGSRIADFGGTLDEVTAVAVQSNNDIVAVGYSSSSSTYGTGGNVEVLRLLPTGLPDTSFGTNGLVTLNFGSDTERANAVAIQSDGQIVVGASVQLVNSNSWDEWEIIRLNSTNGSLDTTFGGGTGRVVTNFGSTAGNFNSNELFDLAIQSDGKIVACGEATPPSAGGVLALARYSTTGLLDSGFGSGGIRTTSQSVMTQGNALTIDPVSGKIVVTGTGPGAQFRTISIARFTTTGNLDSTFGNLGGYRIDDLGAAWASGVVTALDDSGYYVLATVGLSSPTVQVLKFDINGALVTSFGTSGSATVLHGGFFGTSANLTLDHSGNIVAVASTGSGSTTIARLNTLGSFDTSFGSSGVVTRSTGFDVSGVAIDSQNRIVGFDSEGFDSEVFRLTGDGFGTISGKLTLDSNGDGTVQTGEPALSGWTVYADTNNNSQYDPGTDYSAVTDSQGNFTISNVSASNPLGGYQIRVVMPVGYGQEGGIQGFVSANVTLPIGNLLLFQGQRDFGTLFNDANSNGTKDSGEASLTASGFSVYVDANNNGRYDSGETIASVTNGSWFIATTATANLRLLYPSTYRQTSPTSEASLVSSYTSRGSTVSVGQFGAVASTFAASTTYDSDARYITLTFDRYVHTGSGGAAQLTNTDTNQTVTTLFNTIGYLNNFAEISFEPVVIGNSQSPTLPNGHYQFVLPANYLTDSAGNGSPATTINFFVLSGDANHDGQINATDYMAIDNGFNSGTLTGFHNGDFNYDGKINGDDYTIIDNTFNTHVVEATAISTGPATQSQVASSAPAPRVAVSIPFGSVALSYPDSSDSRSIWSKYFDAEEGNSPFDE
jgi:uncharacterized delta-60 repeat protein